MVDLNNIEQPQNTIQEGSKTLLQRLSVEIKKYREQKKESSEQKDQKEYVNFWQEKKEMLRSLEGKTDIKDPESQKKIADLRKEIDAMVGTAGTQTLEEKKAFVEKKKTDMIQQIGVSLKEKWFIPDKFADSMTKYLVDEHVNGIKHSGFENFLYGTVGMFVAGLFLPKGVLDVFEKIKDLSLDDVYKELVGKVDETKDKVKEDIEQYKAKFKSDTIAKLEGLLGRKLDPQKFDAVFDVWWKEDVKTNTNFVDEFGKRLNTDGHANLFDAMCIAVSTPFSLGWKLIVRLREQDLISVNEVMVGSVKTVGSNAMDTVVEYGVGSVGLFTQVGGMLFGQVKLSDIAEYAKEGGASLPPEERMMLWAMMYRHGGIMMKVAANLGTVTGKAISGLFSHGGDYTSHMTAIGKAGLSNDMESQLKIFKEFDDAIGTNDLFPGTKVVGGSSYMRKVLAVSQQNVYLLHAADGAQSLDDVHTFLKKNNMASLSDELTEYRKLHPVAFHGAKETSSYLGTFISNRTNSQVEILEEELKGMKGVLRNVKNGINPLSQFSPINYQQEFIHQIKQEAHVMDKVLQDNDTLASLRKGFRKFNVGRALSAKVDLANDMRFYLKDATEAKEFFQNMRTLAGKSPELARSLFKNMPVVLVGAEVLEEMHQGSSAGKAIMDGALSLMPIVGPLHFLRDAFEVEKDAQGLFPYKIQWGQAGIAAAMVTYDSINFVKSTSALWKNKSVVQGVCEGGAYMFSPLIDALKFSKGVLVDGTYLTMKFAREGGKIIAGGGSSEMALESLRFLKSAAWRAGLIALIAYGGYSRYDSWRGQQKLSAEEQKQLADYQKNPQQFERDLQAKWPTLSQDEKNMYVTLSMSQRLGLQDPFQLESKLVGDSYEMNIQISNLISKSTLDQARNDTQEALSKLEKKPMVLSYRYTNSALSGIKEDIKSSLGTGGTVDKGVAKRYVLAAGYDESFGTSYFPEYFA